MLGALPDTVERLWTGAVDDSKASKPKAKGKGKDAGQEAPDVGPKFGRTRLALHTGEAVFREVVCALLEASGAGKHGRVQPPRFGLLAIFFAGVSHSASPGRFAIDRVCPQQRRRCTEQLFL